MDLTDPQPEEGSSFKAPLLVDKQEIIKILQDLVEKHPTDDIPLEAVEQALAKFLGPRDLGRLNNHPSIERLDKILAQFKNPRTS
jgi:hypothetical protein